MLDITKTFNLPDIEKKVLEFWKKNNIFEKSLKSREGRKPFRFFEGPPTANGRPGIHHVLARAFKDVIPRYKTMRGNFVSRKAGWDTHGLPVEIQVEKELGLKSKKDIEKYGIAEFNKKCKESVWRYKDEWERLTERIGFWLDLKNPYITYENSYIETLWWIFKEIWKKKLLYKGHKVVPWCTRCGTALSSHELALGYKEVSENSVYIKFKLEKGQKIGSFTTDDKTYILSWTTTPWTLPGNVALAVGADIEYVKIEFNRPDRITRPVMLTPGVYIIAKDIAWKAVSENAKLSSEIRELIGLSPEDLRNDVKRFSRNPSGFFEKNRISLVRGKNLVGLEYEPLFEILALKNKKAHRIYTTDFVTTTDGTGVVHTAVMYGEDDYNLGVKAGLPQHHTVDERGMFTKDVPGLRGMYVKDKSTEEKIIAHLKQRKFLFKEEPYTHDYPFCWRCGTHLLYYARESWFIKMSALKNELIKENQNINWVPAHIKAGRFGEWLREIKDWAISRERYWGTPLPIWECGGCGHQEAVDSIAELRKKSLRTNTLFLARHGEAEQNLLRICAFVPERKGKESKLTAKGTREAEAMAKELKKIGIDFIISSPFLRTLNTAKIISRATGAKIITDKRIGEINPGVMGGRSLDEYWKLFIDPVQRFVKAPAGGETLRDVRKRVISFLVDVQKKYNGKRIAVVSHGDPLRVLEGTIEGISERLFHEIPVHEVGEFKKVEYGTLPFNSESELDMHRPYIDAIQLRCGQCGKAMRRVKEVADVWFDSGAMPWAQMHFPFAQFPIFPRPYAEGGAGNFQFPKITDKELSKKLDFPADYISEGIDQTRGWFYTLLAIAVLLGKGAPYRNVISTGLVLDKNGQKMSKSKGNIVDPWQTVEKYGADVVRWYFFTVNDPGDPKRFDEADLLKTYRRFHLLFYNSFVFLETYTKGKNIAAARKYSLLDEWIRARLGESGKAVSAALDAYDVGNATRRIEEFVSDLSHWYIRRSRSRFSNPESKDDFYAAAGTLKFVIGELSKLIAPFCPFISEAIYLSLSDMRLASLKLRRSGHGTRDKAMESVHLENWPENLSAKPDEKLLRDMEEVRRIASIALAERAAAGIKVRQPLQTLKLKTLNLKLQDNKDLIKILEDEVNVKDVIFDPKIDKEIELDTKITPELYEEGVLRELTRAVQKARQDAGYKVGETIYLRLALPKGMVSVAEKHMSDFKKAVSAKQIEIGGAALKMAPKAGAEIETEVNGEKVKIAIRRLR